MTINRGIQGSFKNQMPIITAVVKLTFGYRTLEVELGTDTIRTPSDMVLDFAYSLNLLLAMEGIIPPVLSLFLGVASNKLRELGQDILNYGLDEDILNIYHTARKQGILIRNYPKEGKDKSNTEQ